MPLIPSSVITALGFLFNKTLTVQALSEHQDATGQLLTTWANLAGHIDIKAVISPIVASSAGEDRRTDQVVDRDIFKALLHGYYPTITVSHRAVAEGRTHDITRVVHDSQGLTTTLFLLVVSVPDGGEATPITAAATAAESLAMPAVTDTVAATAAESLAADAATIESRVGFALVNLSEVA